MTINTILPGIIDSEAQRQHVESLVTEDGPSFDEIWNARAAKSPAKRYGRPDEIGALFTFLASEHARPDDGTVNPDGRGDYPGTL